MKCFYLAGWSEEFADKRSGNFCAEIVASQKCSNRDKNYGGIFHGLSSGRG